MNLVAMIFVDPDTDHLVVQLHPDEDMTIRANQGKPLEVKAGGFYEARTELTFNLNEKVGKSS